MNTEDCLNIYIRNNQEDSPEETTPYDNFHYKYNNYTDLHKWTL